MYRAFHYRTREIKYLNLSLFDENNFGKINSCEYSEQVYFGKTAYVADYKRAQEGNIALESTYGPKHTLLGLKNYTPFLYQPGTALYLAPECKMSRDVLRNEGYKITYDKAKADYRVLPFIPRKVHMQQYQIIFVRKNQLFLVTVERQTGDSINNPNSEYSAKWATATELETVLSYLENTYAVSREDMMYRTDKCLKKMNIWFVKVCPDTEYYLTHVTRPNEKFCFDMDVPLNGTTQITPENLVLWSKMNDANLLEKALLNSDWKEYPATVCIFLAKIGNLRQLAAKFSPAGKVMLEYINFNGMYSYYNASLGTQIIQARDWNMLQDFLMLYSGIQGSSGFANDKSLFQESELGKFVRMRLAVGQYKISDPKSYDNIISAIKSLE